MKSKSKSKFQSNPNQIKSSLILILTYPKQRTLEYQHVPTICQQKRVYQLMGISINQVSKTPKE